MTLDDDIYGPEFEPFAQVAKDYNLSGVVICESKDYQGRDAQRMHDMYLNIVGQWYLIMLYIVILWRM